MHLFVIVRVKVPGVEASTHEEAVEKARQQAGQDFYERFATPDSEYAEEISHYLVDVTGDPEYNQSRWFYSEQNPLAANLRRLLAWYDRDRADDDELDQIIAAAREAIRLAV